MADEFSSIRARSRALSAAWNVPRRRKARGSLDKLKFHAWDNTGVVTPCRRAPIVQLASTMKGASKQRGTVNVGHCKTGLLVVWSAAGDRRKSRTACVRLLRNYSTGPTVWWSDQLDTACRRIEASR